MKSINPWNIYGQALKDYLSGAIDSTLIIHSDWFETENLPVSIYFRNYDAFAKMEQEAITHCKGRVLDVGAGAGAHSLYLQETGFDVVAIDLSSKAVETMKQRGVKNVYCIDFFEFQQEKFDTLLFLMNGIGIVEKIKQLNLFFDKCEELLNKNGQVIFESGDIRKIPGFENFSKNQKDTRYFGEVSFWFEYRGMLSAPFDWLYIDFDLVSSIAKNNNWTVEKIMEDPNGHYLARAIKVKR